MPANMADYITVAERLAAARDDIQSIDAGLPTLLDNAMGYIRVVVSLKDGRSATGTASFRLDLTGKGAQATNPIEDCETSAVGRALALLGYHSSRSIASREEVAEAQRREQQPRPVQGAQARTSKPNAPVNNQAPAQQERGAPFGGKLGGDVQNVQTAFTKGGSLCVRFTLGAYTCLVLNAPDELAYLENGDMVKIRGEIETIKGEQVVKVYDLSSANEPDIWKERMAAEQTKLESELEPAL